MGSDGSLVGLGSETVAGRTKASIDKIVLGEPRMYGKESTVKF
jgi:hypothetical protein